VGRLLDALQRLGSLATPSSSTPPTTAAARAQRRAAAAGQQTHDLRSRPPRACLVTGPGVPRPRVIRPRTRWTGIPRSPPGRRESARGTRAGRDLVCCWGQTDTVPTARPANP
jgi:hypothetical protein